MKQTELVALDEHGVVEIVDGTLCEMVSAGVLDAEANLNAICGGAEVNTNCHGSNYDCTLSPNTACGNNTFCTESHI